MYKFLIIALFIIRIFGCEKSKDDLNQDFWIYYSKGSGWTGLSYEIKINSQGKLIVYERRNLPNFSERNMIYDIDQKEIDSLFYGLQAVSLIKLGKYGFNENRPYDFSSTTFKYKFNNHSDSASIYRPGNNEVPIQLDLLLNNINRIIVKYDINK